MAPHSRHTALRAAVVAALAVAVVAASQPSAPSTVDHLAHAAPAEQATPTLTPSSLTINFDQFVPPAAPLPVGPGAPDSVPGLDIHTHSRNSGSWTGLEPMTGVDAMHHGPGCEGPPAKHDSQLPHESYAESAFICAANPHLMTSIKAGGYGLIYLALSHQVDFTAGEAVVKFDVSTLRTSIRDWIDVWITPMENNLVAPLERSWPDLGGEPARAIHVVLGGGNAWIAEVYRPDGAGLPIGTALSMKSWVNLNTFLSPSASRRDTVEIRITRDRLKVCMPMSNFCYNYDPLGAPFRKEIKDPDGTSTSPVTYEPLVPLDWSRGIVQIGHHSYNPHKGCSDPVPPAETTCPANTWHWDNIGISPSVPFTIIRATERFIQAPAPSGSPTTFTFPVPAPADSHLRVAATGIGYQVSVDGGTTWATLTAQPLIKNDAGAMRPYWHPIPAGVTSVKLRTTQSNSLVPDAVNYAAIWSPNGIDGPPPPAETPTPMPTEPPIPTETPTPVQTATPVPPTATSTSTALPVCRQPYEYDAWDTPAETRYLPMGCP